MWDMLLGVPLGKQLGSVQAHIEGPDLTAKLFAVRLIILQKVTRYFQGFRDNRIFHTEFT